MPPDEAFPQCRSAHHNAPQRSKVVSRYKGYRSVVLVGHNKAFAHQQGLRHGRFQILNELSYATLFGSMQVCRRPIIITLIRFPRFVLEVYESQETDG